MLKPPMELPEDAAGHLRALVVNICDELIAMSAPGAEDHEIEANLDRIHELAEELWKLTIDVRVPHQ